MPSGDYLVRCERGEIKQRGNKVAAVFNFSVLGRFTDRGFRKENEGVVLKQWYFLSEISGNKDNIVLDIQPHSKYGVAWVLAMGRPLKRGENPEPKAFEQKIFRVDVGFSSAAGGSFNYRNTGRKKDSRDFLRIHSIREKVEEKALTHMVSYEAIGGHKHVHVNHEHEHDTRALTLTPTSTDTETEHGVIRISGASQMSNEQVPQGHANEAPGLSVESASAKRGVTFIDALRAFPGAKVRQR
jgi:hypothetical protein